jgi:hypothetical protein
MPGTPTASPIRYWRVGTSAVARRTHKPYRSPPPNRVVLLANVFYMGHKRFFHDGWQHRSPILMALAFADQDLVAGKVQIFHSKAQTFQQPQAGTV